MARAPSIRAVVGLVGMRSSSARSSDVTNDGEPISSVGCAVVAVGLRASFILLRIRLVLLGAFTATAEAHTESDRAHPVWVV